ncbi:hypothetical protein L1887_34106 [Cichorium endivia]|nr:hypothetical protein L1887_34106 [Cichorium endivia]
MPRQDLKKTCMETESVDSIEGEEVDALSPDSFDLFDLIAEDYKKIKKTPMQQTELVLDFSCHDTVHVSPPLDAYHVSPLVQGLELGPDVEGVAEISSYLMDMGHAMEFDMKHCNLDGNHSFTRSGDKKFP